ncbi:MAG: cbb3-type cytochrome oxidase assembly protein CcoS [bacterium]|nr:cbb3-type cytochrome oxidase assembly protein CcoS [bacterium]
MNIIFMLIGVSLFMALGFLVAFVWSVKSGQMEDDYTPSVRILFDDKPIAPNDNVSSSQAEPMKSDLNQF